jgi:HTH-type transcriptional regulator / antitoxin HigA
MVATRTRRTEKREVSGYAELLTEYMPTVIKTEKENAQALVKLDRLIRKGEKNWTAAEARIFELLSFLVEQFEERAYPMEKLTSPADSLQVLMEERGLKQADLAPIFGGQSVVSDVLKGKRQINGRQAKQLAEAYNYPVTVFL